MKPFVIPEWRQRQIRRKFGRQKRVTSSAVLAMEAVMHDAVGQIIAHYEKTGRYAEPTLNPMFAVSEDFYRSVVTAAYRSAEDEKADQSGRKRLAAVKKPVGIPRRFRDLEKVFRDRRYWPSIMRRSKLLTERLRKQYLAKLKRKFNEIVPDLRDGVLDPREARRRMMEAWDASKSRVETIFETETTSYFGRTQTAFFEGDPEIIGFMFDSVRDTSRTPWCRSRHGLIYRPGTELLRKNTPSCHWRCRSHLLALANTAYNRALLADPRRDPAKVKVVQLPPGWGR